MQTHPPTRPASARACTANEIQALLNRARQVLLIGAWLGKPENVTFAKGSINALKALQEGSGEKFAARDASMGGYHAAADLQAAWARLPVNIEKLSFAEVQEFLRAHGLQVPFEEVADSDLDAVAQLKDTPVATVHLDDKHDAARADLSDGTGEHGQSLTEVGGADVQPTSIVTRDIYRIMTERLANTGTPRSMACMAQGPATFRLPLAACTHDHWGCIEGRSADGSYEMTLHPAHGVPNCNTQYWAYESRQDEHGRNWTCTQAQFAVDDFGDLVEVPV